MKTKSNIIAFVAFSVFAVTLLTTLSGYTGIGENITNIVELTIDSFEKPNDWKVSFSKFRSRSFEPGITEYLPNNKWIKWITVEPDKPGRKRKALLPPTIAKSPFLDNEKTIISLNADWELKGANWVDIYPSNKRLSSSETSTNSNILEQSQYKSNRTDYSNYILLSGNVESIYCHIWGMGYNYTPEIHVLDYTGKLFVIKGDKLTFRGWNNLRFKIPKYAKQTHRLEPRIRPLRLIKIRIVSDRNEVSKGFYTYLDYLHAKTDIYSPPYFGDTLEKEKLGE